MAVKQELPPVYRPGEVEGRWYRRWEERGYFHPEAGDAGKEGEAAEAGEGRPFTIAIPPPNVTGSLHLGHAWNNTLQDVLIRWRRMQGRRALWQPGTDHAGIATQRAVEMRLCDEGAIENRHDLGREAFVARTWAWKETNEAKIIGQLKALGASCDWERLRFTMDEGFSKAVLEVFVRLYDRGLIYRGPYMIDWCPECLTALSDLEVEHQERDGHLWELHYPLVDGDGHVVVATTRPETMLGDTAVAVHPDDDRYRQLVGRKVLLPLMDREIPIIADDFVDPEFGSGAVKVTPGHDPNDFECGRRHELPAPQVIGRRGTMTDAAGAYAGLDRAACRRQVVEDLKAQGYVGQVRPYRHAVGHCYRCETVVEPLVSEQWFVRMQPLAAPAMDVVRDGRVTIVPDRFTRVYLNWLENVRDWCISRQIWWGHRIPAWHCVDCGGITVAREEPAQCGDCGSTALRQDPDVLDTWFSSALWPYGTLGWPEQTQDLKTFFPTDVLVTGYDIIFFWVARMIFTSLAFTGQVPFRHVYLHGLIRDAEGRKMSKSLGNGIDPMEVIDRYGADALRFSLLRGNAPGNDIRFSWEQAESARNFVNKLWNAARFVLMNVEEAAEVVEPAPPALPDRWILSRAERAAAEVTRHLERFDFGEAAREAYNFVWSEFCDWYIEMAKERLYGEDPAARSRAQRTLLDVLTRTVRLLHPVMPFVTEELHQHLPGAGESVVMGPWPAGREDRRDRQAEAQMAVVMEAVRAIRNLRAEFGIEPGVMVEVAVESDHAERRAALEAAVPELKTLARLAAVEITAPGGRTPGRHVAAAVVAGLEIRLPLAGLIDPDRERSRIDKELGEARQELARSEQKLATEGFLRGAPAEVVERERERRLLLVEKIARLEDRRAVVGDG